MNIKARIVSEGKVVYILTGIDSTNEVAAFPGFLQAAIVARYISGGNMREEDQANAIAAISEYETNLEAGKIHHEAGGGEWEE